MEHVNSTFPPPKGGEPLLKTFISTSKFESNNFRIFRFTVRIVSIDALKLSDVIPVKTIWVDNLERGVMQMRASRK